MKNTDTKQVKNKKAAKSAFKPNAKTSKGSGWVFFIWVFAFLTSAVLTLSISNIMQSANLIVAVIILITIICISIFFDVIGTAVTAADIIPFNSMAARKVYGAKTAIMMIKNADKVSNLCNDVIGDICGIISGASCAYILFMIVDTIKIGNSAYLEALLGGFVAALIIGGKSLSKRFAINNSNSVIFKVSVVITFFKRR